MTRSCTHRIEIKNLCDGEEINHSILLIRGFVSPLCSNANSVQVELQDVGGCKGRALVTSVAHSGEFKALLDLQPYDCAVKDAADVRLPLCVRYCHQASKDIFIVYRPLQRLCRLQPLYIVCRSNDGPTDQYIQNACSIIDLNLRLVQCVYAEKLRLAGFGRYTFALGSACQPFYSTLTCEEAWELSEDKLWQYFAEELLNSSLGSDTNVKFVAFIGCTKYEGADLVATGQQYTYTNIRRFLKAHAALGGGGLALFGSAYFYAWASNFHEILDCFSNETKVDLALHPDDSNYRRTYCGVYATTLGAIVHEIGHIFDLGHTQDGVMGTGFDYLNRVFTVSCRTENLPERVVRPTDLPPAERCRTTGFSKLTTQLNRSATNNFLDKYREQKTSDSFFFSRNCAVILVHHKWLRQQQSSTCDGPVHLHFDTATSSLVSSNSMHPLKLIEVRSNADGLVKRFYEFQPTGEEPAVYQFSLPEKLASLHSSHYLFVLTSTGHVERFGMSTAAST